MKHVLVRYWQKGSRRWVPVDVREQRPVGGIRPESAPDGVDDPRRTKIAKTDARRPSAFERFLDRETYNETSLIAWAYPEVFDEALRRLKVEDPSDVGPVWWMNGKPYRTEPSTEAR